MEKLKIIFRTELEWTSFSISRAEHGEKWRWIVWSINRTAVAQSRHDPGDKYSEVNWSLTRKGNPPPVFHYTFITTPEIPRGLDKLALSSLSLGVVMRSEMSDERLGFIFYMMGYARCAK